MWLLSERVLPPIGNPNNFSLLLQFMITTTASHRKVCIPLFSFFYISHLSMELTTEYSIKLIKA